MRFYKLLCLTLLFSAGQVSAQRGEFFASNEQGKPIDALEVGNSLQMQAQGLEPNSIYEVRMSIDNDTEHLKELVSFSRVSTDIKGNIPNFVLWFQSGVIGCSYRSKQELEQPYTFQSFEEANERLQGRTIIASIHEVERDKYGKRPPMELKTGPALTKIKLPITKRQSPMVYVSNKYGCLLNSREARTEDVFVSGFNFEPYEAVRVSVVGNQRQWQTGDAVNDITGQSRASAAEYVKANKYGQFTVPAWDADLQIRGVYDIIAQREERQIDFTQLDYRDIVSYGQDTGFVMYLYYPPGGPYMDIAGRKLSSGFPYFEFADSFADQNDDVWGAVDPTYVPVGHTGGNYAAYYIVDHKSVPGWNPALGGSTAIADVSGGIEIMRVKSGCINGTDTIIWHAPLNKGEYDVVVDFGSTVAMTATDYTSDWNYNDAIDFLDGGTQVGFVVADDPYDLGTTPIGRMEYSYDDYFATIGGADDVDLRAIVRYPATIAGDNTPVAGGQHPIFFIQHGNHRSCELAGYNHDTCPTRTENHTGYMRLLDILASHGIIAVSIDAYDLTGWVPQWIPERGELILNHIELWSRMNDASTYATYPDPSSGLFTNKVNMNKISVSGHSRGGEASVSAFVQNAAFNIVAVSSIAPTDRVDFSNPQYTLGDVPYFVILPAADGDVSTLHGARLYDRAGSTIGNAIVKSGMHLYGANHNFFNTLWASHGDDANPARDEYIAAWKQQQIGEAFLSAFTRLHLNNETVYQDMMRGNLVFPSTSGVNNYSFHHEKNHNALETGSDNVTSSVSISKAVVNGPSVHTTQALEIGWNASGDSFSYTVPVGQRDVSGFEVLSFRAAQTNDASNPAAGSQKFKIELTGGGHTKATYITNFDDIPQPYNRTGADHNVMTTVRIPLHSFIINNSNVDLTDIDTVKFSFNYTSTSGEIYVDDVEFSR
jgi:hypothetical protein